jgi:transcriptional regulator with XRE-family HTH domain
MNDFSTNLKYLRCEYKLSQQQIADSIGIKQRTYSDYETGKSEPQLDVLKKLAKFFRVSLDVLVGFTLDIALNKEDRAFIKELSDKSEMGNAELVGEILLQSGEVVKSKIVKKEPKILNKALVEHAKVINKKSDCDDDLSV